MRTESSVTMPRAPFEKLTKKSVMITPSTNPSTTSLLLLKAR